MADNIVGSLFGVDPQMLAQQRQAVDMQNAYKIAQLSPMERAQMAIYQGGMGIGRGLTGLLGGDAEMQKISQIKQLSTQFDLASPTGMREFARALQPIAPNEAMMAAKRADEMMATQEQTALRAAQTQQAEAGKVIQVDLGDRIQLVNALTREVIREIPKGLTPQQAAKARAGAGGEDGVGQPGPVGKAGAYKDIYGTVFGTTEMKNIRTEFGEGQKLLDSLNKITAQDIKDSESYMDWTTAGVTKGLASSKTLSAQTKLAASQLIEQINSLPPGSASDADMRAAMKSFPGYSDPESLRLWVNRTKEKLQSRLGDISEQFNFKQRTQSSGDIAFTKGKQPVKINAQPSQSGGVIKLD